MAAGSVDAGISPPWTPHAFFMGQYNESLSFWDLRRLCSPVAFVQGTITANEDGGFTNSSVSVSDGTAAFDRFNSACAIGTAGLKTSPGLSGVVRAANNGCKRAKTRRQRSARWAPSCAPSRPIACGKADHVTSHSPGRDQRKRTNPYARNGRNGDPCIP